MLALSRQTVWKWSNKDTYENGWRARQEIQDNIFKYKDSTDETQPVEVGCNSADNNKSWMLMLLLENATPNDLINITNKDLTIAEAKNLLERIAEGTYRQRIRGLSVLMHLRGTPVRQTARLLMVNRRTVTETIRHYRENGLSDLFSFRVQQPKKHELPEYKDTLFSILHSPPSDHGINRTSWIIPDLQRVMHERGLPINKHSLRLIINNAGYRLKKAKKVLTSTDPDYRMKLEAITGILSRLTESELFFSIDEFGPVSVKFKSGVAWTAPGEQRTVPQFQKSRGKLQLIGALELSTNQITHFYADRKNTEEMIKLLHLLLLQHKVKKRLYISWDAASWHGSKQFDNEVRRFNTKEYRDINGTPEIVLAPLPACAQFLNVIESVFSGMARAIIHNSNYRSAEECKSCIDRYFLERNQYYINNPKRAGDKIWGKERVVPIFKSSNNCKDPLYQ